MGWFFTAVIVLGGTLIAQYFASPKQYEPNKDWIETSRKIEHSIYDVDKSNFEWTRPFTQLTWYEIRSGNKLLLTYRDGLYWFGDNRVVVTAKDHEWEIGKKGWRKPLQIFSVGSETPVASITFNKPSKAHRLLEVGQDQYIFSHNGFGKYIVSNGGMLLDVKNKEPIGWVGLPGCTLTVTPEGFDCKDLNLLLVVGWFLIYSDLRTNYGV